MDKIVTTIILAVIGIAALVWACTSGFSGLAWFPGFFVAVFCGIMILDVHEVDKKKSSHKCGPGC